MSKREGISSSSPPPPCAVPAAKDTAGILRSALKLPTKNEKLMIQSFLLLVLSPLSLLVLLHYLIASPLIQKVEDTYETSSLDPKDLRTLLGIEIPFSLIFSFFFLFGISVTIHSSALTYNGKSKTLKELFLSLIPTWKKPLITYIYVSILTIVYIVVSFFSLQLMSLIGFGDVSYVCNWVIGIVDVLIYLYLGSVWILGLVVSVVEEGESCYGVEAIGKAWWLIRGRRIQGFCLMSILGVLSVPIYVIFFVTTTDDDDELSFVTRVGFVFIATVLFCLVNCFTFMVFTVFHFECKRSHGQGLEREFGPAEYVLVSTVSSDY